MKSLAKYNGTSLDLWETSGYDLSTIPATVTTLYLWGTSGYDLSTIPATVKIINGKSGYQA